MLNKKKLNIKHSVYRGSTDINQSCRFVHHSVQLCTISKKFYTNFFFVDLTPRKDEFHYPKMVDNEVSAP